MNANDGYLRIGELSRRVGAGVESLRAWERRYGLLSPSRTPGGFRLYGDADVRRVQLMQQHLAAGLSAAEAARLALADVAPAPSAGRADATPVDEISAGLRHALDTFDEAAAHAAFDRALASLTLDALLRSVVLPYLRELGDRWVRGEASIAQEHFASALLRGRLLGLARDWGEGRGPLAVLACAPGEPHDLGLICFGLSLNARGWRIVYLGADTPAETLAETARLLEPALVVVNVVTAPAQPLEALTDLPGGSRLVLAGAGAGPELAAALGAELMELDPVTAAQAIAA